jgi:hypothetical protein
VAVSDIRPPQAVIWAKTDIGGASVIEAGVRFHGVTLHIKMNKAKTAAIKIPARKASMRYFLSAVAL